MGRVRSLEGVAWLVRRLRDMSILLGIMALHAIISGCIDAVTRL